MALDNNNPNKPVAKKKGKVTLYKELVPAGWEKKTQNCHYVFLTGNGSVRKHIADVCFARFYHESGIVKGKFLINQHNTPSTYSNNAQYIKDEKFREKLLVWINWIVKQSPFRYAFTNGKTNFLSHGLNFNCNVSHKYVFGACNAIREGWEFPWRVEAWYELVNAGVSKELSYYVVSMFGKDNILIGGQGHAVMQSVPSGQAFDWFRKLSKGEVDRIGPPMKTNAGTTYGVSSLFCSGREQGRYKDVFKKQDLKTFLRPFMNKAKRVNEWGDEINIVSFPNPELIKALKEIDCA